MKVKSIVIELEPDEGQSGHATTLEFKDGMWRMNGPVYPRISAALRDIYCLLTGSRP